jgi:ribonuclease-3
MNNHNEEDPEVLISIPYNDKNILIVSEDVERLLSNFGINIKVKNIEIFREAVSHYSYVNQKYYSKFTKEMNEMKRIRNKLVEQSNDNNISLTQGIVELRDISSERLEFAGDGTIKDSLCTYLYLRYKIDPRGDEGFMTYLKTKIEDKSTFARFSKELGIDTYILISKQTELIKGRNSDKILEDAFEAFIGALKIDQGHDVCEKLLYYFFENYVDYPSLIYQNENYKDQLMQLFHSNKWVSPIYWEISCKVSGASTQKIYTMGVLDPMTTLDDKGRPTNIIIIANGEGTSKQRAEQQAALNALIKFKQIREEQIK